jgi:hypothetical protein
MIYPFHLLLRNKAEVNSRFNSVGITGIGMLDNFVYRVAHSCFVVLGNANKNAILAREGTF